MKKQVSSLRFSVDAIAFIGVLVMAAYSQWSARDLLWSLWISSLTIGYLTILAGFSGYALRGRLPDGPGGGETGETTENAPPGAVLAVFFLLPIAGIFGFSRVTLVFAVMAAFSVGATIFKHTRGPDSEVADHFLSGFLINLLINFPAAIFMIAFFTIHFGGFHFIHGIFLNGFFPLVDDQPFGKTPAQTAVMFSDFIRISLQDYWFFIVASAASSGGSIIGALKGGKKDFMLEPYKNVIKMHLMIFIIAFAGAAGFHQYVLYAVLFLYFFPVKEIINRMRASKTD